TIDWQRTSQTYTGKRICRALRFFCAAIPPDSILQTDLAPGKCWAFPGSQGQVVIRLPAQIWPIAVTAQHISKMLFPDNDLSSSPKDISISVSLCGAFVVGVCFAFPFFLLQNEPHKYFNYIKINILSNWGNKEYTCLYHFKLHGKKAQP
ncbi:SUN3 protein, partial [Nothocercus julius]|nr:SUN3 protein [Nothocercus julius]